SSGSLRVRPLTLGERCVMQKHRLAMLRGTALDVFAWRSDVSESLVAEFQRHMMHGVRSKSAGATLSTVYRTRLSVFRRRLAPKGRTMSMTERLVSVRARSLIDFSRRTTSRLTFDNENKRASHILTPSNRTSPVPRKSDTDTLCVIFFKMRLLRCSTPRRRHL